MKNKIYLFLLCLAGCFISCDDFLDIQPKGIVIPKNYEDYEKLINYAQLLKASHSYPNFMTDDVYLPDDGDVNFNDLEVPERNLYMFQAEIFGDAERDGLWEYSYNRIYYYNTIIEDVMDVEDATWEQKRALRAEALLGRAFEYLTLVNAYANHYDESTAATDLGVPLMLDKNINKSDLTRATVQKVYDQVLADLDTAALYLPDKQKTAYRASKPVGLGMLARMYLYMGEYAEALKYAELSLAENSSLLDLKNYSVVQPDRSIGRTDVPYGADNPENIYIRLAPWTYGFSGTAFGSDELVALYDKEHDMRFKLFFSNYAWGVNYDNYLWMPYIYANMAMSVPEIILIAAECEARVGSKDQAMLYLDQLLEYRIVGYQPQTAATNQEALDKVLTERRKEMCMLGCTRVIDLKRLNREPRYAKTITHVANGQTYTLAPDSPRYIFPIPPKVLSFNPNMEPNKR